MAAHNAAAEKRKQVGGRDCWKGADGCGAGCMGLGAAVRASAGQGQWPVARARGPE